MRNGLRRLRRLRDPPPSIPDEPLTLTLNVSGLAARSATVAVVPSDPSQTYYFSVVRSADFTDDETLIAADLAAFGRDADDKGLSLGDYLGRILSTGPDSFTFSNKLEPQTAYFAYAYGLTAEGTATTAVFRQSFTTPAEQHKPSDCTFRIEIPEVAASEATVRFIPSDETTRYFYTVLEREIFDKAQAEGGIFADDMQVFEYMAQMDNQTVEATIRQMTVTGTKTQKYVSLSPDTDYYAYAYGLEPDGFVTTELYVEPFRTEAPSRRECTFEITIEGIAATEATVSVIPSDKQITYLGQYITDEQIAQGGGGDLQTYYANYFRAMADMAGVPVSEVVAQEVITGDLVASRITGLTEGETYNVFAVGVDAYGNFITDVELVRFEARNTAGPGGSTPFTLVLTDLSDASVRLEVTPGDGASRYLAGVVARDEAATFGGVSGYCRAELDMYDAMGMIDTYLDSHAHTGSWSGVFDRLEPGSSYEAYAVGVDDRGAFTTPFTEQSFVAGAAGAAAVRMRRAALPHAMRQMADPRAGIPCSRPG